MLYTAPFNLSRLEVTGQPVKVQDNVHTWPGSGSGSFDVSATGSLVYIPDGSVVSEAHLLWLDRQGTSTPLLQERRRYVDAALDPEGTRLVAAIADDFGEADLWVHEIERGTWARITSGMNAAARPVWSPDGKWIFSTSFKSGEGELFRVPSRGGSPEQLTSVVDFWEFPGSLTPDGRTLAFHQNGMGQNHLMTLLLSRAAPRSA